MGVFSDGTPYLTFRAGPSAFVPDSPHDAIGAAEPMPDEVKQK